jgi:hypothetical protein
MSIPGAENPHKVKNIVSPQIHRFRGLYGRLLYEMKGVVADEPDRLRGVKLEVGGPVDEKRERELAWRATGLGVEGGEGILRVIIDEAQPDTSWKADAFTALVISKTNRQNIEPIYFRNSLERYEDR